MGRDYLIHVSLIAFLAKNILILRIHLFMVSILMISVGDLFSGLFSSALLKSQVAINSVDNCCYFSY